MRIINITVFFFLSFLAVTTCVCVQYLSYAVNLIETSRVLGVFVLDVSCMCYLYVRLINFEKSFIDFAQQELRWRVRASNANINSQVINLTRQLRT